MLLLAALVERSAAAQTAEPGQQELDDVVHLVTGVDLRAKVIQLGDDKVEVELAGGERQTIPRSNVVSIDYGVGHSPPAAEPDGAAESAGDTPAPSRAEFVQVSASVGLAMPTEMTPERVFPTHTGVGPVLRIESGISPGRYVELGGYFSISHHPIVEVDGLSGEPTGGIGLFSVGGYLKARIALSPRALLRLGADLGANLTSLELQGGGDYSGVGLNFGPTVDFRGAVSDRFALLGKIGFWSQVTGGAELPAVVDGDREVDFTFAPSIFMTFGGEMMF
jgi:hypothetical protein